MTDIAEHYASHLAPIYLWMAGGYDAAMSRGEAEIEAICPGRANGQIAVDLGAGFGMHAVPLARRGCSVVAIDTSAILLGILRDHVDGLPVQTIDDDLRAFQKHLDTKVDLILCMGDTLTHLPDHRSVEKLFTDIANSLHADGRFIVTFRDYTTPLNGNERFIPVRSDADRILTCFLEYTDDHVTVHDILHERSATVWQQRISSYRKLRLSPEWIVKSLQVRGFTVRVEPGLAGMLRVIAIVSGTGVSAGVPA
ncbi:class I SAM-dependent methyltransferase [Telmatospirillum sp.]|uniref:class I SAM-dependent methyltransferase n=1 Tax=Telmatospirillum sp. TaxID=2079197 RepID=UPI00284369B3|nr:class I SAM-dependent methyltransferase [Telmatospirillum sp.]MDR3436080.1 class I SAM-dependent methyltransferase [Telmatospirillum sp.]